MSFKKKFFKSISNLAVYSYISQGLEFFSTIILSRLLLPEEYGFVAIITIFSGFIQLFSNVGIGTSIVRSDYGFTFHRYLYNLSVWMGILFALVLMILSYPIALLYDNLELVLPIIVISFKFIFDSFAYVPYALLSKGLRFKNLGTAKLWGTIFQISVSIVLALAGFSYWALILPMVFSSIVQFLYLKNKVDVRLKLYGWRATKLAFNKIKYLMGNLSLNNFVSYWSGNADKAIIGKLYTQADLGLYNRAFRFITISNRLIGSIFSTVLFPSLKDLMANNGNVNKEYLDILRTITLFNIPIVIILVLFPDFLVLKLWGKDWIEVAIYLPYVAIILIYQSILWTMTSVFILFKKERTLLYINIVNTVLTLVFVIIGGLFSMLHIIQFLTIGLIVVTIPINIYFGFYKAFNFSAKSLFSFWTPLIILGCGLFYAVYEDILYLQISVLILFIVVLLIGMRNTVLSLFKMIKGKIL
jgi:PST family polysaccharide transporter